MLGRFTFFNLNVLFYFEILSIVVNINNRKKKISRYMVSLSTVWVRLNEKVCDTTPLITK